MNKKESRGGFKDVFKTIMTVISWAAFILLILVGAFLLYYAINSYLYSTRGQKYEPPVSLYTIISPSMEPKIKVYDVIINTKVTTPADLEVGDIITFTSTSSISAGMTVTHRIIEIQEVDGGVVYRTKGDNNQTPDVGTVPFNNVIGKTVMKVPQLGRIQFLLASKGGWFLLIVIPALGVIIYDILKLFRLVGVKSKVDKVINEPVEDETKKVLEDSRKRKLKAKLKPKSDNKNKLDKTTSESEEQTEYDKTIEDALEVLEKAKKQNAKSKKRKK